MRKKPELIFKSMIDNSKLLSSRSCRSNSRFEQYQLTYIAKEILILKFIGWWCTTLFNCNDTTNNPKNQDDLSDSVPPGFCSQIAYLQKVEVYGTGTKTAAMIPIVSSVDGSILTLQIIEKGFGYTSSNSQYH